MKIKIAYKLILVFFFVATSCTEEKVLETVAPSGVIETSLSYFEGDVIVNSITKIDEIDVWEVQIQNVNTALVSIRWRIEPLTLYQIEGSRGPFNYELSPGNNLINFSTARTIATGQVNGANLLQWVLKQNQVDDSKWVYAFDFEKTAPMPATVYIDASNGNILQVD